jgi:indole-3-glycerol phosphate synthase
MAEFLSTITEHVRESVARRKRETPVSVLRNRTLFQAQTRGLARSLSGTTRQVIAEIKRASPSRGLIRADFDPVAIAKDYAAHGASAISVLTEERFFQGSLGYLEQIHDAVAQPLLRKDFIIDAYQVFEAKSYGADAILLIAAMLDCSAMRDLRSQAAELSLDVLIEIHNESELEAALAAGAQLVGINNRDLKTFEVDIGVTEKLVPRLPARTVAVCESGIDSLEQIQRLERLGIHNFLIGESLMRAPQPGKKLRELLAH